MSDLPQLTSLVTFSVLVEGNDVETKYEFISIKVVKEANRIASAQLIIRDGHIAKNEFSASDKDDFLPGKKIEIKAGYHNKNETIFKGLILSQGLKVWAGSSSLVVECKDEVFKMTLGKKNKYFSKKKDDEILKAVMADYSFGKEVDATNTVHKEVIQYYAADWDFALMRAEKNGMMAYVDDNKISIKKPELSAGEVLTLTYGSDILELETRLDASNQFAASKSQAWDYSAQALIEQSGKEPSVNEQGNVTGKKLSDVGGLSSYDLLHAGKLETAELKSWADALLLKSRLSKIQGTVTSPGNAMAKVGEIIKLEGVGERYSGKAFVSGLTHEISNGNWKTTFKMGMPHNWFSTLPDITDTPAAGLFPAVNGLQVGTVLKLEKDPDNEFRVQIKLPLVDSKSEGIWARISRFYASDGIGAFFMPEIGDEVIVGFINDDPRFPVILGMFNSSSLSAPLTPADKNPQKQILTKSKLSLMFDDDKKVITIMTPGKNTVTISDDAKSITLLDQHNNKVEMNSSGILLDSKSEVNIKAATNINLEAKSNIVIKATANVDVSGLNVTHKANAKFAASGNAGAEVKTSAIAVIQGSLVKIN